WHNATNRHVTSSLHFSPGAGTSFVHLAFYLPGLRPASGPCATRKYQLMGQRWVPRLNACCWAISAPPMPDWPCCRRVSLVRSSGSLLLSLLDLPTPSIRF